VPVGHFVLAAKPAVSGCNVKHAVAVVLGWLLFSLPTLAAPFFTGNTLKDYCDAGQGTGRSGLCIGFIVGVHDSTEYSGQFCIPASVQAEQLIDVVKIFLEQNPQLRHLNATGAVVGSLSAAFPC
jgi:hypothetical protein